MGADRPPLAGITAGTQILDIGVTLDFQTGAIFGFSFAHQAAQNRRCIIATHHSAHLNESFGMFHCWPTPSVHQEPFSNLNQSHGRNASVRNGAL